MKNLTKISCLAFLGLLFAVGSVGASTVEGNLSTGINAGIDGLVIAAPIATPAAGTYTSKQDVVLTAIGATSIHYTIDGTEPSCASALVYQSGVAIPVDKSLTIKALSCYANSEQSAVVSFAYVINIPVITPPAENNGGGGSGGSGSSGGTSGGTGSAGGGLPASVQSVPKVLGVTIVLADDLITETDGKDGPKVKDLQKELIRLGFLPANYMATTTYDTVTEAAVKKYQASKISVVTPDIQYSKKLNSNFVKVEGSPAVYWFSAEGKRYLFSNRDTFGSWFGDDFAGLRTVSQDEFNSIPAGENVTIKPGEYLKFDNSDITYLVKDNNNICKTSSQPTKSVFLIQSGFEVDYNKIGVCAL